MFKCENTDCENEHDGSYGSGRFCSLKCKRHYIGVVSAQTAIRNGNKHCPPNFKCNNVAPYGTWKCKLCGQNFKTRTDRTNHNK